MFLILRIRVHSECVLILFYNDSGFSVWGVWDYMWCGEAPYWRLRSSVSNLSIIMQQCRGSTEQKVFDADMRIPEWVTRMEMVDSVMWMGLIPVQVWVWSTRYLTSGCFFCARGRCGEIFFEQYVGDRTWYWNPILHACGAYCSSSKDAAASLSVCLIERFQVDASAAIVPLEIVEDATRCSDERLKTCFFTAPGH